MAIPLFLARADGAQVVSIDDASVTTDRGAAFTPTLVSGRFRLRAGGWQRLRRVVQELAVGDTATLAVTPVADGAEAGSATSTVSLSAGAGAEVPAGAPMASAGSAHQVRLAVTAHTGVVSLGPWSVWLVPRRATRQ